MAVGDGCLEGSARRASRPICRSRRRTRPPRGRTRRPGSDRPGSRRARHRALPAATMSTHPSADLRRRTLIVAVLLAGAFVGLIGRLAYLQVVKHDDYKKL